MMFIIGKGRRALGVVATWRYSGRPADAAAAFADASETARIALAPRRAFVGEIDHAAVDARLIGGIQPEQRLAQLAIDVAYRTPHTLAAVSRLVAIA
jgi:hypothetical protein